MNKQRKILNIIAEIRSSHSEITNIFSYGSCLNFHLILRAIYPEAKPWYNVSHIITEIDGKFYDISGCVSSKGYLEYGTFYSKRRMSRSFSQMYRAEYDVKSGRDRIYDRTTLYYHSEGEAVTTVCVHCKTRQRHKDLIFCKKCIIDHNKQTG